MKRQNSRAKVNAERCSFTPLEILTRSQANAPDTLFLTGFTIAEILLVVIIVALVAGVGGGMWVGTYKKMLAEKAARGFVFAAKHARLTAIERQSPCTMELDTDENRFALVIYAFDVETGRTEQIPLRDFYFKKPVEFAGDVEFEDIQITPIGEREMAEANEEKTIVFSPDGTAQSAVIQMGDGRNHYTVGISAATGRAKMHFGTADEVETGTVDLDEER